MIPGFRAALRSEYELLDDEELKAQLRYYNLPERDTPDSDNWEVLALVAAKRWGSDWLRAAFDEMDPS